MEWTKKWLNTEKRKIKVWININNKPIESQKFQQQLMMQWVKYKILREHPKSNRKSKFYRDLYQKTKRNPLNLSFPKFNHWILYNKKDKLRSVM